MAEVDQSPEGMVEFWYGPKTVADSAQPMNVGKAGELRAAGFSDEEITQWAAEKRDVLKGAGFDDKQIAEYLGGPQVPNKVPESVISRLMHGTKVGRVLSAIGSGAKEGFRPEPLGFSPKSEEALGRWGIFSNPETGYNGISGPLRFANEAMMKPAAAGLDAFFRSWNAGFTAIGAGVGQVAEEMGEEQGMAARLARDVTKIVEFTAILSATQQPMVRMEMQPDGRVLEQSVGHLPKVQDFHDAAKVVGGETPTAGTHGKLMRLYDEKGLHPAEVVADAARNPVIKQSLLSSDHLDMPTSYGGKPMLPPKGPPPTVPPEAPPAAPSPPPAGSLAAAQETVLSKISVGGKEAEAKWSLSHVYTQLIDDLHPFEKISKDAYQTARLTRGTNGKVEHILEHGGPFDFNTYKQVGPSFKSIIEPVRENMDGLRAYLVSRRAIVLEASGKKTGIDLDAAQKVVAEGEGTFGGVARQLAEYQSQVLTYLKDSGVISDASFKAMSEAKDVYVPFYRVMPEWKGTEGVGKSFGPGNPIKGLTGSELAIIDPLESIIKNTYAYVSIAERNAAGLKLIDAIKAAQDTAAKGAKVKPETILEVKTLPRPTSLEAVRASLADVGIKNAPDELANLVREIAQGPQGETIGAFRNGVRETYRITDPDLLNAYRALDSGSVDMLTKVLAIPAKTLRAGATITPDFIARNVVRDFMQAFVNTGKGAFTPLDTGRGLVGVIRKDMDFESWMKSGGANATLVHLDRLYMQESLRKLTGETGLMDRAWNVVTSPLHALRMASELAENATRLGEFKRLTTGGPMTKEALQAAAFSSREVTLDFARIGGSMRAYNMITAFLNANIQGTDRVARAFKDHPVATTAKVAGGITLPSVLLWWANHDDPRYKELPQWQKDLFWIVMTKDHIYRVPKPFELGVVFGSGAERALDAYFGDNPKAFKHFSDSMIDAVTPNFIPTVLAPLVDQFANRSTFMDRTLIPASMEKHLPEYQYKEYTTELAKTLGRMVSEIPGVRDAAIDPGKTVAGPVARAVTTPILIENYVRAWTGGMGGYVLQAADAGLRKAGVLPDPPKPAATLADIPFVKAFVVRHPSAGAQSIQDFYDEYDKGKRYFDTWMARAKEGDQGAMLRIQEAGGPRMFVQLDSIKKALGEHQKLVRDVYKNPTMKPEEKRQLIDLYYGNMIAVGQSGKAILEGLDRALSKKQPELVMPPRSAAPSPIIMGGDLRVPKQGLPGADQMQGSAVRLP